MGQSPVTPVNIPIPSKIGSKMRGAPTPKWDPIGFDPQPLPFCQTNSFQDPQVVLMFFFFFLDPTDVRHASPGFEHVQAPLMPGPVQARCVSRFRRPGKCCSRQVILLVGYNKLAINIKL